MITALRPWMLVAGVLAVMAGHAYGQRLRIAGLQRDVGILQSSLRAAQVALVAAKSEALAAKAGAEELGRFVAHGAELRKRLAADGDALRTREEYNAPMDDFDRDLDQRLR